MIANREEDGCKVMECYLSDKLASDREDKKQSNKTRSEQAASNKKNREASKHKDK